MVTLWSVSRLKLSEAIFELVNDLLLDPVWDPDTLHSLYKDSFQQPQKLDQTSNMSLFQQGKHSVTVILVTVSPWPWTETITFRKPKNYCHLECTQL